MRKTIGKILVQKNWGKTRGGVMLAAVACTFMLCGLAIAFDPDALGYGHSFITRSIAKDGYNKVSRELHAINPFTATPAGERGHLGRARASHHRSPALWKILELMR